MSNYFIKFFDIFVFFNIFSLNFLMKMCYNLFMTNEEIKRWCKAKKISQKKLAEMISYSEGAVRQALNDIIPMQERMLEAIKNVISYFDAPITAELPPDIAARLQEKADAAKKSIAEFIDEVMTAALCGQGEPAKGEKRNAQPKRVDFHTDPQKQTDDKKTPL